MLENDAPKELYEVYGLTADSAYTMEDWKRQQEQNDRLTIPGLDGFTADKAAFRQMMAISTAVSAEQLQSLRQRIRLQMKERGLTHITGTFIVQFAKGLPLPDEMKKLMIPLLEGMLED